MSLDSYTSFSLANKSCGSWAWDREATVPALPDDGAIKETSTGPRAVRTQSRKRQCISLFNTTIVFSYYTVKLKTTFCQFSSPEILQSDNGSEFVADVITDLVKSWPGTLIRGRPRHPQLQSMVERGNQDLELKFGNILLQVPSLI